MKNCELLQRDDGRWWCPACDTKQEHTLGENLPRNCRGTSSGPGTLIKKVTTYLGIYWLVNNIAKLIGRKSCGCGERAEALDSWWARLKKNLTK